MTLNLSVNPVEQRQFTHCVKCAQPKGPGRECEKCGAIYERAEAAHRKYLADMEREYAALIDEEKSNQAAIEERAKKEAEAQRLARLEQERSERERRETIRSHVFANEGKSQVATSTYSVDCSACNLPAGMAPAKIRRFTGMVQVAGAIITAPSILGIISAIMVVVFPFGRTEGFFVRLGIGIGVFCFSAVMGTVGWLLISKRSVFLCRRCGFILDRTTE